MGYSNAGVVCDSMTGEQKWAKLQLIAQAVNLYTLANTYATENLAREVALLHSHGIQTPDIDQHIISVGKMIKQDERFQRIISAVIIGDLGLRNTPTDLDVMAKPGTPAEELLQYQDLGYVWFVIGVVVVFGAIALGTHFFSESVKISKRDKLHKKFIEKTACADPNSQLCQDWKALRQSPAYTSTESIWESASKKAIKAGKLIAKGFSIGVAIAIPIAAFLLLKKNR